MRITQERSYSGMSEGYPRVSQDSPGVTKEGVNGIPQGRPSYPRAGQDSRWERAGLPGRASEAGDGKAPGSLWGGRAGSEGRTRLPEWASRGLRGVGRS